MTNEEFQLMLVGKLNEFQAWLQSQHYDACRLVQYCGIECVGAIDVALDEVEIEIKGALREGYGVAWATNDRKLYLVVWEPDGLPWTWPQVFCEEHLDDLNKYLMG